MEITKDNFFEVIKTHLKNISDLVEKQEKKYTKDAGVKLRKALDAFGNDKTAIKRAILAFEETLPKKKRKPKEN